ncbi:MAG: TasA family protein [Tumebacillaceae bacterium]
MKKNKKLALLAVTGVVATSLAVGGASYALFTSNATNTGNSFTAGTLKVEANRDDIPTVGPMFYTDTSALPGTMATGFWAPGDKYTRGLFLKNTGSLDARLKSITANTADASGNVVSSGSYYTSDLAFSSHSKLKIWQVNWFNPLGGLIPWTKLDATQMDAIMKYVNDGYAAWAAGNPNADPANDPNALNQLVEYVNKYLLDHINDIKASGKVIDDGTVKVTRLYNASLDDLTNKTYNVSNFNIQTKPGESVLLAYTMELKKDTGNDMQGASAYFNFGSTWEQVRNN